MPQSPLPPALQSMPPRETLPTMYDLPSEDPEELGLPDEFHLMQPRLLQETCQSPILARETLFFGTDLNLYYDWRHPLWHKRPDWFLVMGVNLATRQQELRWSYVVWQEQVSPFLVIELLSPGTEEDDLGHTARGSHQPPTKWEVYEQILQIPYYGVFDRYENHFRLFQLQEGCYEPVDLIEPQFWFAELELGLGVWSGPYDGVEGLWLRWYDAEGNWVPTRQERAERAEQQAEQERQRAEQERQRAEQERQRAEQERQRAEQLAARLRALGIDPEDG
ncbi:Uma2 family endonuclease [Trichothermofontia sichuanensis B231]|uniref:Uma2 family endonuclease n=1 Tax=Trichothermofontia sichuanensis TaxID=3045816 RepID=UPI002245D95B|nr:Uma2 family endonuclease [Trichothermofontia sichuanensis]UZQ54349.1 Uma2 family endonuclease [Trichothermofontia sichuanensis B231]